MSNPHDNHGDHQPADAGALPEARLVASYTPKGHEIDYTPNKNLFGFLAVMAVLLVLTAAGVYQLFVGHTDAQMEAAWNRPSMEMQAHAARDADYNGNWGVVQVEGKNVGYRMPISLARQMVVANPARFSAAPPPADWIHPDDAVVPPPAPAPAP